MQKEQEEQVLEEKPLGSQPGGFVSTLLKGCCDLYGALWLLFVSFWKPLGWDRNTGPSRRLRVSCCSAKSCLEPPVIFKILLDSAFEGFLRSFQMSPSETLAFLSTFFCSLLLVCPSSPLSRTLDQPNSLGGIKQSCCQSVLFSLQNPRLEGSPLESIVKLCHVSLSNHIWTLSSPHPHLLTRGLHDRKTIEWLDKKKIQLLLNF